MPVPTLVSSLSQTAGSNSPAGSDAPTVADDHLRAAYAFIAGLRDGKGYTAAATVASATTTDVGGQNTLFVEISGTTTITSFGTAYNGPRFCRATGAFTLTNSSTLALPGGADITTASGDTWIAYPNIAANGWNVSGYQRAATSYQASTIASGSAISLITGSISDITSMSLPAGDWDVSAVAGFICGASTSVTAVAASPSLTSGTLDVTAEASQRYAAFVPGATSIILATGVLRVNIATTTTVYLPSVANFTVSTCGAWGTLRARRAR